VDLPTYTNIWRIEKRLYKLYDFRLPMPLPIGQIAVFAAIALPYIIVLTILGLPFSHTYFWLYVLPPGVLAWLATRPVLESKRLPELIVSQVRYLGEPRTWCRLAPLAEKDEVVVYARVWHQAGLRAQPAMADEAAPSVSAVPAQAGGRAARPGVAARPGAPRTAGAAPGRAKLRSAGVDPATLESQLDAELREALHLMVVLHLPGGHTETYVAQDGQVRTVSARAGGTDWDHVVKFGLAIALAVVAAMFLLAAGMGARRNRRRAVQRYEARPPTDRAPLS
jgi:hypothetical protein